MQSHIKMPRPTLVAAAVASTLALCSASAFASVSIVKGVVGGAYFAPPVFADTAAASSGSSSVASVYAGATVCFDLNGNGVCDAGEPTTTTNAAGGFTLASTTIAPLVAQINTTGKNNGNAITSRNVFRANLAQVQAATANALLGATVNLTPLSTEVALAIENKGLSYTQAVDNLAERLGVASTDVLLPPTQVTNAAELPAIVQESVVAQNRLSLAAKFVDRGDTVGELRGNFDCPSVAAAATISAAPFNTSNGCAAGDTATVGILAAQQWAFNLEGMPQYDAVFVIILENESQSSVQGNSAAPYINQLLTSGGVYDNYYSTGDPSEPNYLALGAADDWGQTGDEALPYPAVTGVRANLFNEVDATGQSWRVYEGSMWPSPAGTQANIAGASSWNSANGTAWFDNPTESSIVGTDGTEYTSSLRAVKHHPAIWYADVTAQPNFLQNDRSIAGTGYGNNGIGTDVNGNVIPYAFGTAPKSTGDWDNALQAFATANGVTSWWTGAAQTWNVDQFRLDLQSGNVGNLNFIVPDQDDDMHNTGVTSRADYFVNNTVAKIESSALWKNPNKRVAIVVTFDEGESAQTACCGWNPERSGDAADQPVAVAADGTVTNVAGVTGTEAFNGKAYSSTYSKGNHGHGVTVFGVYTNQQALGNVTTGGNYDTDYYSHFSFVRTMQDVLGLSDPGLPGSYANRSKYTESFIEENATVLPEFAGSSNPHFDAVRAMNHVYQFPAGVSRVVAAGALPVPVATGPDATQVNLWATQN